MVAGTSAGAVGNGVSAADEGAGSWVTGADTGASGVGGDPPAPDIDAWSGCAQTTEDTNNATVRILTVGTSIFHTHDCRVPHPLPPPWQSTNSYQAIQLSQGPSAKQSSNYLAAATSLDGVRRNQLSVIRKHDREGLGGLCKNEMMHLMAFVGTTFRRNRCAGGADLSVSSLSRR